jgi:hypothetical protein
MGGSGDGEDTARGRKIDCLIRRNFNGEGNRLEKWQWTWMNFSGKVQL